MGLPAPWLIGLVLLCVLLAAIPTRRLADAGLRPAWLGTYLLVVSALGIAVVAARGPGRFLVPVLVVLFVAPLLVGPETLARWLSRGRRPPKHVGSGPGRDVGPADVGPAEAGGPPRDGRAGAPKQVGSGSGRDAGGEDGGPAPDGPGGAGGGGSAAA